MDPVSNDILENDVVLVGQSPNDPNKRVIFDVDRDATGNFHIHERGSSYGGKWEPDYSSGGEAIEALRNYIEITYPSFNFDLDFIGEVIAVAAERSTNEAPKTSNAVPTRETEPKIENGTRAGTSNPDNNRLESLDDSLWDYSPEQNNLTRAEKSTAGSTADVGSARSNVGAERQRANNRILDMAEKDRDLQQRWIHTREPESVLTAQGSKIDNYLSYDPGLLRQRFAEEEFSARNWERIQLATSTPGFGFGSGLVYLLGGSQRAQDAAGFALAAGLNVTPTNFLNPRATTTTPEKQAMSWRFKSPSRTSKGWRGKNKGIAEIRKRNKTRDIHPSTANEGFVRKVNWPSPQNVPIDMVHVMSNHHPTGPGAKARLQPGGLGTSLWPAEMTAREIEAVIRDAYRNIDARKAVEAGGQHIVQGTSGIFRVEMSVDVANGRITTGYWIN